MAKTTDPNTVFFSAKFATEENALLFVKAIKNKFVAVINKTVVTIQSPVSTVAAYNLSKIANHYFAIRIEF